MENNDGLVQNSNAEPFDMVRGLADFRNDAIRDGKPTDDIDDLLLKVIDAPPKRKRGLWRNEAR